MTSVEDPQVVPPLLKGHTQKFTLRGTRLLSQGQRSIKMITTENLAVDTKVYCGGGENALHKHLRDDHGFFVLAGKAKFYDKDGGVIEVGPLDGIVIPKNTFYRFEADPSENLVLLRMQGSAEDRYSLAAKPLRMGADERELDGKSPENHGKSPASLPAVESGEMFG